MEPAIWRWLDAIYDDKRLRDLADAGYYDIRLIAIDIARCSKNNSGLGCFQSAETIAKQIGCHHKTIERYRKQLIDLGWFKVVSRNGGDNRRSLVLDISLPGEVNGDG
jgi:hypothetical protein